jgi:peptidoglycan/xylan/chitin deacetylase (PgdA/CDA1 family)
MLVAVNFHYVREDFSQKYPSIFGLTPSQFENQLIRLSKAGNFVSPKEILEHIIADRELPKNAILVTFDDGLKEQYDLAKPILDKMGIPAMYYINPINSNEKVVSTVHKIHLLRADFSLAYLSNLLFDNKAQLSKEDELKAEIHYNYDDKETAHFKYYLNFKLSPIEQKVTIDELFSTLFSNEEEISADLYMQFDEIKEIAKNDELGSHGYEHFPLGQIESDLLLNLFIKADHYFKNRIGYKPFSISYPYGSFEACAGEVLKNSKNFDFVFGFSMERAANFYPKDNSLLLSRFDCNDVPGGKNFSLNDDVFFDQIKNRQWKI